MADKRGELSQTIGQPLLLGKAATDRSIRDTRAIQDHNSCSGIVYSR